MKTKIAFTFALLLLCPVLGVSSPNDRRDGNWWRAQPETIKVGYMVGFLDGEHLGNEFASWDFMDDPRSEPCLKKVLISTLRFEKQYLQNVKVGQLTDGLDDFYADYKNRSISVDNAVWLVLNGIAGTPKDKLDKMIEAARRNAN